MGSERPIVLFTGVQRLAREVSRMGYESACLVEPGEQPSDPQDVAHWIPYDPSDLEALESWARNWEHRDRVVAVINRRERRVMEHAVLNRALGRQGLTLEQAMIMRDKLSLRKHLARGASHLNPRFKEVGLGGRVPSSLRFPVLLKPRNFFKSQLIVSCPKRQDWERAMAEVSSGWEDAQRRHGVRLEQTLVAEQEVSGLHFSIDAMIGSDGSVLFTPAVDLTTAKQWALDDNHVAIRSMPIYVGPEDECRLQEAVRDLVESLGLKASPIHVDLVMEEDERVLVLDATPRIGGYRSEMMELAWGCSLDLMSLKLALGEQVEWAPRWQRSVAVVELFPETPGVLKAIHGLERVRALESFHRLKQRVPLGSQVGLARGGFRCPLFVVLCHPERGVVSRDISLLRRYVHLEVSAS